NGRRTGKLWSTARPGRLPVPPSRGRKEPSPMDRRASPANDVTENGTVEEALRQSEQRLQQVINSAPVVLFAVDRHGVLTWSEGKGLAALGLQPGEAVGKSAFVRYQDNPAIIDTIRRALGGEDVTAIGEIKGRIYECRCCPTRGTDGEI